MAQHIHRTVYVPDNRDERISVELPSGAQLLTLQEIPGQQGEADAIKLWFVSRPSPRTKTIMLAIFDEGEEVVENPDYDFKYLGCCTFDAEMRFVYELEHKPRIFTGGIVGK
jgi:hypothetical protein